MTDKLSAKIEFLRMVERERPYETQDDYAHAIEQHFRALLDVVEAAQAFNSAHMDGAVCDKAVCRWCKMTRALTALSEIPNDD